MDFAWGTIAFLATAALAVSLRDSLRVPALLKRNYAGREIVTGAGVLAVFGFLLTAAFLTVINHNRAGWLYDSNVIVVGFSVVGLLDDVIGGHGARGFRGHLTALGHGQLTSGAVKLLLGVAIATIATLTTEGLGVQLLRVVVIAGSANVANLLDLAPGRATKGGLIAFVPVLFLQHDHEYFLVGQIMFMGAVLALLPFEFREEMMLGDAGANALGAMVGSAWVVATAGNDAALVLTALVVIGINVAGELVSFSRVIDRIGVLRHFDRLGRRS
jgi:hypothetical protein